MEKLDDYKPAELLVLWQQTIKTFAVQWKHPTKHTLALNVSRVLPGKASRSLPEDIVKYAQTTLDKQLVTQNNSLHATTNTEWAIYKLVISNPRYGWQFVSPVGNQERFGGTYDEAMAKAGDAEYVEIYQGDLVYVD